MKNNNIKKVDTYKIDFQNKKVIVMQDYADRAGENINGKENETLTALLEKYKDYEFIYKKSVSSEKKTHSGLNYTRIETFITRFDPAATKRLQDETRYYKTITPKWNSKVRSWFIREYPEYQEVEELVNANIADKDRLNFVREQKDNKAKENGEQSAKILPFEEKTAATA